MPLLSAWKFAPAPWLTGFDRSTLDTVLETDLHEAEKKTFENPAFSVKCVWDARNYFAADLFARISLSDREDQKLNLVLPSPHDAVYVSAAENLNKFKVNLRNVNIFFFDEYANENNEVAPPDSPVSRSGRFMKNFYGRLAPELRMKEEQICFWTTENAADYSKLLEDAGGADVIYADTTWTGLRYIDPDGFAADTMDGYLALGSRIVTPAEEQMAFDSLRGMFGNSGDIANVPPRTATIGPKDIAAAKLTLTYEYMSAAHGMNVLQQPALKLALFGPVGPQNPGSLLRLFPGTVYISDTVASNTVFRPDVPWLEETINEIRKQEAERR
ncbi:MAG: hypothetical protein IJJ50_07000 [Lachnospiraceae bacterium]|nr:hypothetical protein [Lachnospiraceae bacterium]MBQ6546072.1 hypothetical protein [Lachnospiraceae bacterium]